ncbi:MAG TPA: hypothetical protein VNK04_11845 [Gemmataceae bacterium]|nr:hypothetical protein [Gemmataceae bacterium]
MDPQVFDELERTVATEGPAAAIDRLCTRLREQKDYGSLFYALLMKKRYELGVSPLPTGPAQDLPESAHAPYEQAIREAGRLVGRLYLEAGDIPQAWAYFRMLGEPEPVAAALERYQPRDDDDVQTLVHIAFYEGVHPRKGFDWILERNGICNAITTLGSVELPHSADVRRYCVQRLVRALYQELRERLAADIAHRTGGPAPTGSVRELLAERDWLFADEYAHIDISHLSAVVQMSIQLEPGEELNLARELCQYGQRLPARLRYPGDPPFEDQYRAYGLYLDALAGENVEEALAYFRRQAEEADPETVGTYPAEVLVNLLLRLDRPAEALAVARRFLTKVDSRRLSCPGIAELCRLAGDYGTLAEVAREQGDTVHFLAGLIAVSRHGTH